MNNPYTEIILKVKGVHKDQLWYLFHPMDLRDKIKYKSNKYGIVRATTRSQYYNLISDSVSLFNYEE